MTDVATLWHIADTVRIAVTPVFLLTGLAGILAAVTSRLGRIIGRARELAGREKNALTAEERAELTLLPRRIRLINGSVLCSVLSRTVGLHRHRAAVRIQPTTKPVGIAVALTFIISIALLMAALVGFLAEVRLALSLDYVRPEASRSPAEALPGDFQELPAFQSAA